MSSLVHKLDGHWQMIRAEFEGESVPELVAAKTCLELAEARYSITFDGEIMDAGQLRTEATPTHHALTLQCQAGANRGRTVRAIYQCMGDRLRICFSFADERPSAFATTPSSKLYLATYRRVGG